MAEWSGRALQKLPQRFESARDLDFNDPSPKMRGFFISMFSKILYWTGLMACAILIISCFMPWTYYPDIHETFTGFFSEQNQYGKPGIFLSALGIFSIVLILLPKTWAKRTNLFVCALCVGYSIKTYILFTSCYNTFCPEKQTGIYLMFVSTLVMLIASIFPDLKMEKNK